MQREVVFGELAAERGRAYGTVVSLVRDASQKAQIIHNQEVKQIETEEVIADEMWSFAVKISSMQNAHHFYLISMHFYPDTIVTNADAIPI